MPRPLVLLLCLFVFSHAPAAAADFEIALRDRAGAPVRNAVVTLHPADGAQGAGRAFAWKYQMAQRDIAFVPHVLIVPEGADVEFPNFDRVRHHVYSFSRPNDFELKLYGREEQRRVAFEHAGTVAMGCNIHDEMSGFIRVVDTPFAAKSTPDGRARIEDVPAGAARLTIWHPYLRAKDNQIVRAVVLPLAPQSMTLKLKIP